MAEKRLLNKGAVEGQDPATWVKQVSDEVNKNDWHMMGLYFGGMYQGYLDSGMTSGEALLITTESFARMTAAVRKEGGSGD